MNFLFGKPYVEISYGFDSKWGGTFLGKLRNNEYTNDEKLDLCGRATPFSLIKIYDGDKLVATTKTNIFGHWHVNFGSLFGPDALKDGTHKFTAVAYTSNGNESKPSNEFTLNVDTKMIKPEITKVIDDVIGGDYHDGISKGDYTNDNKLDLKGKAEANSIVKIYDGLRLVATTKADTNGNWDISFGENGIKVLSDGKHSLYVKSYDKAGHCCKSDVFSFCVDTKISQTQILCGFDTMKGGDYYSKLWNGDITNDNKLDLHGKAEAFSIVKIYNNGKVIAQTKADMFGKWKVYFGDGYQSKTLVDGDYTFTAIATDKAGNMSTSKPFKLTVETDNIEAKADVIDGDLYIASQYRDYDFDFKTFNSMKKHNKGDAFLGENGTDVIYIKVTDFLANDKALNKGDSIRLYSVDAFAGATASIVNYCGQQHVKLTVPTNFNGESGFEYTIVNSAGHKATSEVKVIGNENPYDEADMRWEFFSQTTIGTSKDDYINADAGHDTVKAGSGDDVVVGGRGKDNLYGQDGDDKLVFENYDKVVDGGNGFDIAYFEDSGCIDIEAIKNIEVLDMKYNGKNTLDLSIGDVVDMTDDCNYLEIRGDLEDRITLDSNKWIEYETIDSGKDGVNYRTFNSTGNCCATLKIEEDVNIII